MNKFLILVTLSALFVFKLDALKCHGLVRNYKNYTKFHTDNGEDCSGLSKYCFFVSGVVDSVSGVYIAGCDELLAEPDFSQLHLNCSVIINFFKFF